jgi:hypothetical protein
MLQRALAYNGAPRSMKMGTTRSLWRYDVVRQAVLQWPTPRRPAISRWASRLDSDIGSPVWLIVKADLPILSGARQETPKSELCLTWKIFGN